MKSNKEVWLAAVITALATLLAAWITTCDSNLPPNSTVNNHHNTIINNEHQEQSSSNTTYEATEAIPTKSETKSSPTGKKVSASRKILAGRVIDEVTHTGIADVKVNSPMGYQTTSDSEGHFELDITDYEADHSIDLNFSKSGYESKYILQPVVRPVFIKLEKKIDHEK